MKLNTAVYEEGAGPTIVFVHAFPLDASMWEQQSFALRDEFHVLSYDLPGFGASPVADSPLSLEDCADHLVSLLDSRNIRRSVIAGCSLGGYIALAFIAKYPARAAGLVLADTRCGADTPEAQAGRFALAGATLERGLDPVVESLLPKLLSDAALSARPELKDDVERMMRSATPAGAAAMLKAMAGRADASEALLAFPNPVCVIVGEADVLTPPAESRKMADLAAHSRLHVLPDAGHLANLEKPDQFNGIVRDFCRAVRDERAD